MTSVDATARSSDPIIDEGPLKTAEELEAGAERIIRDHVLLGVAAGLFPGPGIDIALGFGVQLTMLKRMSSLYDVPFRSNLAKSTVAALLGSIGAVGAGVVTAMSFLKAIPVVGTAVGIAGTSAFLGAFTYAIGKVFQRHFETGGTFADLEPDAYREYFREMFQRGKKVAEETAKDKEAVKNARKKAASGQ